MDLTEILKEFSNELTYHYKAYRFSHYALYNLKYVFEDWKIKHPQLENFVIEDNDFNIQIRFNEEEIEETNETGLYQRILAGSTLATFYNLWEDKYRTSIANSKQMNKNDIKSEFFYELNKIRQAIIHNNFNRTSDCEKLEILSFILNKKKFNLSSTEVEKIYQLALSEIQSIN